MVAGARLSVHAVPTKDGHQFFRTMTEAKAFAKHQRRRIGLGGYTVYTLDGVYVIGLLNKHGPSDGLEDING